MVKVLKLFGNDVVQTIAIFLEPAETVDMLLQLCQPSLCKTPSTSGHTFFRKK